MTPDSPIVVEAQVDTCGQLTIRATPRKPTAKVDLWVGDQVVARATSWTGPLPTIEAGGPLVVRAETGPHEATATPEAPLGATIELAAPAGSYRPSAVNFALGGCAGLEDATWRVELDGTVAEGTLVAGTQASHSYQTWEGAHVVTASVIWRGWEVARTRRTLEVIEAPLDADGDGMAAGADCDDFDAWSRPGLPEIAHDGRDNDCDGVLAGDGDGDGFDADGERTSDLDAEALAALGEVSPGADMFPGLFLRAPRLREADCADRDPARHPWAADAPCASIQVTLPGTEGADPGSTPATAAMLSGERLLVLGAGDADVLAFPGVGTELRNLPLRVEAADAPVWVELWRSGTTAGLGPLRDSQPALRFRVPPGAPLVLPVPPVPPKPEGSMTGALVGAVGSLWKEDGPPIPGPIAVTISAYALVAGAPIAGAIDLGRAEARADAARRTVLEPGELVYLRVAPAVPGTTARVRVALGPEG